MWRVNSLERTLMLGKIEGRRRCEWQRMRSLGWMASLTQWTWVCANFKWWWGTGKPGALQFLGLQRVKQLSNQTTTTTNVSFRNHSATGLAKKPIWVFLPCCYVKTRGTFWPIQYFFQTWVLPGPKGTEPATALGAHADVLISPLSLCVALGS